MKQIKVKTLTAESFKEFGSFTDFMNPEWLQPGRFLSGQTENAQFRKHADDFFAASDT